MPKADMAVLATSVVAMADQIMHAIHDNSEDHSDEATSHYIKAAIAGAIAVGAYEMLRRDEEIDSDSEDDGERRCRCGSTHEGECKPGHKKQIRKGDAREWHDVDKGHNRDLMAEAAGAYALGRQLLGHTNHHILKLVAEGLGAAALAKRVNQDS